MRPRSRRPATLPARGRKRGNIGIVPERRRPESRRMALAALGPAIPATAPSAPTRRVAMLAYPDAQVLDVVGPLEVFSRASRLLVEAGRRQPAYVVEVLGMAQGTFRVSSGVGLVADRRYDQA